MDFIFYAAKRDLNLKATSQFSNNPRLDCINQKPSLGENSSTNSLKLILPSPSLSHLCNMPWSSRSVAKNPLFAKNSLRSSTRRYPSTSLSMKAKACFMLKYSRFRKLQRRTSHALSHLNMAPHKFRSSFRVSGLKNCEIGMLRLM